MGISKYKKEPFQTAPFSFCGRMTALPTRGAFGKTRPGAKSTDFLWGQLQLQNVLQEVCGQIMNDLPAVGKGGVGTGYIEGAGGLFCSAVF